MASPKLLDKDWIRKSFFVAENDLSNVEVRNRYFSSASLKYVSTSPGGNIMLNPPPQFTRFADIKPRNIRSKNPETYFAFNDTTSLGRYYSEAIDDNAHLVHFRMGKTAYTSYLGFLTGFYSYYAGKVAKTGRAPGFFYTLGRVAGFIVAFKNIVPFALMMLYKFASFALGSPKSKYAYLKPTMPLYWGALQSMVNRVAVGLGTVTAPMVHANSGGEGFGNLSDTVAPNGIEDFQYYWTEDASEVYHRILPDVFDSSGNLNVYAYATKGQRLANAFRKRVSDSIDSSSDNSDVTQHLIGLYQQTLDLPPQKQSYDEYISNWQKTSLGEWKQGGTKLVEEFEDLQGDNYDDFFKAEMQDGSAFITLRVEEGGSVNESFSNSAGESALKSKMDGLMSSIREKVDSLGGGKLLDDGIAGKIFSGMANTITDFVGGSLDTVGLGGLAALGGGAFADIPQHWVSSSSSMPRGNYTIKLNTPYNNRISKLVNEIVPLCAILCMALPHSTGQQSYTGPFMLEFYDRGRCQTRYGMVDSISITRGTASTPFGQDRLWNGVEISLGIIDLTSVMHMPLTEGWTRRAQATGGTYAGPVGAAVGGVYDLVKNSSSAIASFFTDDNLYTDYMSTLAAMGLADQIYFSKKWRHKIALIAKNFKTTYSAPSIAMAYGDTAIANFGKLFYRGSERAF